MKEEVNSFTPKATPHHQHSFQMEGELIDLQQSAAVLTVQSQGSFAVAPSQPGGLIISASGVKRNKKGARKQNEGAQMGSHGSGINDSNAKYKDIPGVSDWFLAKKQELEK